MHPETLKEILAAHQEIKRKRSLKLWKQITPLLAIFLTITTSWGVGLHYALTLNFKKERHLNIKNCPDQPGINCINLDTLEYPIISLYDDNFNTLPHNPTTPPRETETKNPLIILTELSVNN